MFSAPVETVSPFDTMTPALALMEALIAALAHKFGDVFAERMEAARTLYRITEDQKPPATDPPARRGQRPRKNQ